MSAESRNRPCPCGSGRKYKHCCGKEAAARNRAPANLPPKTARATPITLPDGRAVSVPVAIQMAVQLHQAGRPRKADELYNAVLRIEPDHPDALHLHGLVAHQLGDHATAITLIHRAIALNPKAAMFHNNLGETYLAMNRFAEAIAACEKAIALQPEFPEAHYNMARALQGQGRLDQAVRRLERVLKYKPDFTAAQAALVETLYRQGEVDAALARCRQELSRHPDNLTLLCCLGIVLRKSGRHDEAIEHYCQAIARCPNEPELYNNLAIAYQSAKRPSEAAECYRKLLELQPGNDTARHLLNTLSNGNTQRAPKGYVREIFDNYAQGFDKHLVEKLEYQTPKILAGAIEKNLDPARQQLRILDLGCGTGLFGEQTGAFRGYLVGIDLSPKMIEKARERGIYDDLMIGDLVECLSVMDEQSFDLAVAADVFVYLGDLSDIFLQVRRILSPAGLFAFSIETVADDAKDYVLNPSGRYAQSGNYVRQLSEQFGFVVSSSVAVTLRKDQGEPVAGSIYLLQKRRENQDST